MTFRTALSLVAVLVVGLPTLALAGPPLLCFPMSIDASASLPWGTGGWKAPRADYDRARLVDDAIALLAPATPTLVRMETLRRATIYAADDAALSMRLADALRDRATRRGADTLAVFDFGYFVEAMRQARHGSTIALPFAATDDGVALVERALAQRPHDAAMHYAAALVTISRNASATAEAHLRSAVQGASQDAALARTVSAHHDLWGGKVQAMQSAAR